MVCYCCVKGCNNSSQNKKKDPNSVISFHAIPSNQELKRKWLRAIGRPIWSPPSHARICSAHFNFEQINYDGCRVRVKDDAIPINALPPNSNFEASNVEVCRICLATNLRLYNLQDNQLGLYMDCIIGINDNNHNIEGLPQYVCYQCAAYLHKCYKLVEKSRIAQATLLGIFAKNGEITKNLIENQDRVILNLNSHLNCSKITNYINIQYDDHTNKIYVDNAEGIPENLIFLKNEDDFTHKNDENKDVIRIGEGNDELKILENSNNNVITEEVQFDVERSESNTPIQDTKSDSESDLKENILTCKTEEKKNHTPKKDKNRTNEGLTPDETDMKEHFDIVKLSQQEQIDEWIRMVTKRPFTSETVYECKTCLKIFAHLNTFRTHKISHELSQGKSECPVCKLRFKNNVLMKSHANRMHGKKFYCKTCPKVFNNVGVAKKHHRWHCGHRYQCALCPFTSAHESALGAHARGQHARAHVCAACGRACVSARGLALHRASAHRDIPKTDENELRYTCEECNVGFTSEGARRIHILTSSQHRKKPDLCNPTTQDPRLKNTCIKCGAEFTSLSKLISHTKSDHPRQSKKTSWRMPNDSYPMECLLCGETVSNRQNHWWHVRKHHPKEKDTYQPVVTAVCDTCGKGFQNKTKLHIHQLRHGRPSVQCGQCPRMFYDKYALARHGATHSLATPHCCTICSRAFKRRTNLERHLRVHSDVTPYECTMCGKKFKYSTSRNLHIRTVHHKMPHPPRKKRTRSTRDTSDLHDV